MSIKYDHEKTDKTTSAAYWRKQVYDWMESNGFKISDPQQRELSHLLKEMCNARTKDLQQRLTALNNKKEGAL